MKIICIGRNYVSHIEELGNDNPETPVIFLKPDTAIIQKNMPFVIPEFSNNIHYEVEVLVKISKVGRYIDEKFAPKYYTEIGLGIDFTARDLQKQLKEKGLPWEKAKAFDGSAAIGSFVPKTMFESVSNIDFSMAKNGVTVQKSNTSYMIHSIDKIISHISKFFTLKTGDIIFTGTPSGVGAVSKGDVLQGFINNIEVFDVRVR